jgi:hypothetical protein
MNELGDVAFIFVALNRNKWSNCNLNMGGFHFFQRERPFTLKGNKRKTSQRRNFYMENVSFAI